MQTATPRAQLHLQRLLEKSGKSYIPNPYGAVSASTDDASDAVAAPGGVHRLSSQKCGHGSVHRGSSGHAPAPSKKRRGSIMSITRDSRSNSSPYLGRHTSNADGGAHGNHHSTDPRSGAYGEGSENGYDDMDQAAAHVGEESSYPPEESHSNGNSDRVNGTDGHDAHDDNEEEEQEGGVYRYGDYDDVYGGGSDANGVESTDGHGPHRDGSSDSYRGPAGEQGEEDNHNGSGAHRESSRADAPMHPGAYRNASNPGQGPRSASQSHGRAGTPLTVYNAEGHPICDVGFDANGNPATVTYDEDDNPIYGPPDNSTLPGSVVVELLNQREEARRLAEERNEMRARLEELERSQGTISAGGGTHTPPTLANTHNGAFVNPSGDYGTPDHRLSAQNRDSHFLVSLPEESATNRDVRGSGNRAAIPLGGMDKQYSTPEDVERAESRARVHLAAAHDDAFLELLEEAEEAVKSMVDDKQAFMARAGSAMAAARADSSTPNSCALVPAAQIITTLQQEKDIADLRESLTEAEEKIARLEEANTALRLQLVLQKAHRPN